MELPNLQPILETLAMVISVTGAVLGALLMATWVSLVIWAFHDIRQRSDDVFTQLMAATMVAVLFVPGAFLYSMLRPQETLAAVRERKLLEEALVPAQPEPEFACPACEREVQRRWMVCPYCLYQLREPCPQCGELMELDWRSCAFCGQLAGEQQRLPSAPVLPSVPVPALGLSLPGDGNGSHGNGNGGNSRGDHADRATPSRSLPPYDQAPI